MQRNSQLSSNAEPVCMSDSLPRLYLSWIQSQHLGVNPISAQKKKRKKKIYIYRVGLIKLNPLSNLHHEESTFSSFEIRVQFPVN